VRLVVSVALLGILASGCRVGDYFPATPTYSPAPAITPGFTLDIDPTLEPRHRVDEVVAIALNDIDDMARGAAAEGLPTTPARITKIWLRRQSDLQSVDPNAPGSTDSNVVWLVRAEGTFTTNHTGSVPRSPAVWSSGYLIVDDATGGIIGQGSP
jgi:hypothetical protein